MKMATTSFSSLPSDEFNNTIAADPVILQELNLEGEIAHSQQVETHNKSTLDEPIKETILRDARAIGSKFKHVFFPKQSRQHLLKDWDLWGPLLICVILSFLLQGYDAESDGQPEFAEVFVIFWIGSTIVTLNSKLLGGRISFFQCVCILGYCVLPLALSLIVCRLVLVSIHMWEISFAIRLIAVVVSLSWSTFASTVFLSSSIPPMKKAMGLYPIFLFYFIIGWLVLSRT